MEKSKREKKQEGTKKLSYFYVLFCKDQSLYAGYTTDLKRREAEHNAGTAAKYTRPHTRRPLKMIYAEKFHSKSEAMRAEYAFKQLKRPQKEKYLKENDVIFPLTKHTGCTIKEKVDEE